MSALDGTGRLSPRLAAVVMTALGVIWALLSFAVLGVLADGDLDPWQRPVFTAAMVFAVGAPASMSVTAYLARMRALTLVTLGLAAGALILAFLGFVAFAEL